MKDKTLVSIVTPSYNQGNFIEDTILSVKNQDYPNIEHIIVDGGSADNTLEILRKYENEYNLRWISEPDEGQSDAVNKGFEMAKGETIGWLNSDDVYFDKGVIPYVVEQFKKFPEADVIHGDNVLINKDNLILKVRHAFPWFSYNRLLRTNLIIQSATFYKTSVVQSNELDVDLDLVMDYEYWLRIARAGLRFKRVNKILSANRIHSAAKTQSKPEELKIERRKVQERYGQKFDTRYRLLMYSDTLLFALLSRIYGLTMIPKLYINSEQQSFVFPAKFDPLPKIMFRQLFPFT
jgi:glycosyltransferase involved in cell wall biosynthesis